MASSLKKLLKAGPTSPDLTRASDELRTDGPRGAAVLGSALLDDLLKATILNHMVSLSIEERDRLFTGTGPLSSFSTKIQLAYAMGIIGKKVRHDLDTIREMRNAMAHASKQINFETKEIVTLCRGLHVLRTIDKREDLTRAQDIFAESVRLLMIYLIGKFAPPHLVAAMPPKLRDLD